MNRQFRRQMKQMQNLQGVLGKAQDELEMKTVEASSGHQRRGPGKQSGRVAGYGASRRPHYTHAE